MKTYNLNKYLLLFIILLLQFSCSLIDEENTPEIDIQTQLIPYEVEFQYNLITPKDTDPEKVTFLYYDQKFSSIINTLINGSVNTLNFVYDDTNDNNLTSILIKDQNEVIIKTYTLEYNDASIVINSNNEKLIEVVLHNNNLLYSIENFQKKHISYYTYESGELSVKRTFDISSDISNGIPTEVYDFTYSPFGSALFSSITSINNLLIISEMDEFLLTRYLATSNNRVNLGLSEEQSKIHVDYRTIFNEDEFPTSISMIYRQEDGTPTKQIIHSISYVDITPY